MRLVALAELVGAQLVGPDAEVTHVAELSTARPGAIAALFSRRHCAAANTTQASAVLVSLPLSPSLPTGCAQLLTDDPRTALGDALRVLHPPPRPAPGVHPTAVISPAASLDATASIGPFCVIEAGAQIGAGCVLMAGAYVGEGTTLGEGATLLPYAVVLAGCVIGPGAHLGSHAVIGGPGFGFDAHGPVPHIGQVELGASVRIGNGTSVDRATLGTTRVEAHAKLDNLVQVGHNARVGRGAVLCGQVGLAGGAKVEEGAMLGGQAGVAGSVTVGAGARVAAQSGVTHDLPPSGTYSGHPAESNRARLRRIAKLRRLADL